MISIRTPTDDGYPTCERTYATLRILHHDLDPDSVTRTLDIQPTGVQVRGRPQADRYGVSHVPEVGGWFLSTKDQVVSRDLRRHLQWLIDRLNGRDEALRALGSGGFQMDVFCFWLSTQGHGGPILSPEIMQRFGALGLEIGLDLYG